MVFVAVRKIVKVWTILVGSLYLENRKCSDYSLLKSQSGQALVEFLEVSQTLTPLGEPLYFELLLQPRLLFLVLEGGRKSGFKSRREA